jgi:tRNA pseudouridine32 synthase / 23S rRNA pseudouridine746 synthase
MAACPGKATEERAPDVALVWEPADSDNRYDIRVSLQAIEDKERTIGPDCMFSESEIFSGDATPASVLLYERQLRKAQHAKKVGMALNPKDLQVVFLDDYIVVANKPSGLLCVPGINANPSLLDLVYERYGGQAGDPQTMIVHRLDMDTSGLVLFARLPDVAKKLHAMFRDQQVSKEYECLVMGHFPLLSCRGNPNPDSPSRMMIDLPLQRDHENPPFMRVSTPQSEVAAMACVSQLQKHGWKKLVRKRPKPSQTLVSVVEFGTRGNNSLQYTRLRLEPITGRTHQLRVHW